MTDNSPDFAALVAAAAHPRAVALSPCLRCKHLGPPSPDPDLRLCRKCLQQVQGLFLEDEAESTNPNQEGRIPAPNSGA